MTDGELLVRIDERVSNMADDIKEIKDELVMLNGNDGVPRCQDKERRITSLENHRWWLIAAIISLALTVIYTNFSENKCTHEKGDEKITTVVEEMLDYV